MSKDLSRFLCMALRHKPETLQLSLDKAGWVSVSDLIAACNRRGSPLDLPELQRIVAENDKKRLEFSADGSLIRASQGHSIAVDLGYVAEEPPELLYHGTIGEYLASIRKVGLIKGSRHHVHLSPDIPTAIKVGQRRGRPVILPIRSRSMFHAKHKFFRSTNGVWLTDRVPPEYIIFPKP